MLKLFKNLKQSLILVVGIIMLLIIQAFADLSLPEYTSKIVNIGIQANGIEDVAPEVIRDKQMDKLLFITEDDEKILSNYKLISKDNLSEEEYEKYIKKYTELENQNLYVLKDEIKGEKKEELNNVIQKPLLILSYLENKEFTDQLLTEMTTENNNSGEVKNPELVNDVFSKINPEYLKEIELLEALKLLPKDTCKNVLNEIDKVVEERFGTMIPQMAITATKAEYIACGINMEKYQINYLIKAGFQMLGVALVSMITGISIMFLSSKVAARLGNVLREKMFTKILGFSVREFREFSTASLITRSTNDIQQIQGLVAILFRVVIYSPIIGIGAFIRIMTKSDTSMAWIIGLALSLIMIVVIILFIVAMPKFKKLQELIDKINLVAREILTGLPVIRAFNKEDKEIKRFDKANTDLMKTNLFVNRTMSMMMPALTLVMNGVSILIVWVGSHNVNDGIMQVGDMMSFIQYTMQVVMSFLMISMISIMLPRASVSAKRINDVLDTESSIKDKENTISFNKNKKGLVEFKNVSFRYPDADIEILQDITFTAEPGKTTAIIGSTGSGKSTVVNLIPRFYDVTGGELLVSGVNVKDVKQSELRDKIGFVPQKGILFSGTIESNIKYADNSLSDKKMKEAAEIAQATEFINKKEEKYNSEIAQGGNNVSGGQKQRLSIARAIASDPDIFVFDDSFSALDFKTDAKLREELGKKTKDKTVIIVAQRISTILNADQIIVLEEGKIVGKGTHKELMKDCDTYIQIATSQLSKEELE